MTKGSASSARSRLRTSARRAWPEFALFLALTLTVIAAYSTYSLSENQRRTRVRELTAKVGGAVHHRLRIFEHAMHNARSFVMSRGLDQYSVAEFDRFVRGLDVDAQSPGLRSLRFVTLSQCAGEREPRRRAALAAARDTGHVTLTNRFADARFELYLPVFEGDSVLGAVTARRAQVRGWIRADVGAEEFLREAVADLRRLHGDLGVEVFDGEERGPENRFFVSETPGATYLKPVGVLTKYLANHAWTVRVRPTPETFGRFAPSQWLYVALLGLAASVWIYLNVKRAARYARSLQRSEQLLSLIMDGVPAMISFISAEERYVYVNSGYERIKARPRDQIVGRTVREVMGEQFYERFGGHLHRALAGEPVSFEHDLFKVDGLRRIVNGRYIPFLNDRGEVVGVVALVNDVTEERAGAEQLRAVARENAKLCAEAQALNRVKDDFLATLSHELRTPLNVILGYGELLSEEPLSTEAHGFVEVIQRNARAQNQLIADLLDISAIINGKLSFAPGLVNLSEVVGNVVDGVAFAARAKGVILRTDAIAPNLFVNGDATRLQQILWNLLANAVKFTPAGGEVSIATRRSGGQVEVEVRDSGVGIDADFLPYVFDRFRQEDASRTRRFGGLGLGLSIVRHLVEMHGGQVRVASRGKNQGATFTVVIPRAERALYLTEDLA